MAWAISKENGYSLATESTAFAAATDDTKQSSTIDFIGKDKDFMVLVTSGTGTVVFDVFVQGSYDGTTWFNLTELIADCGASASNGELYDASADGACPYYRISCEKDSGAGTNTLAITVSEVG